MDTDMFDDRLTKISDLSYLKNPAIGTQQKSAILSQRLN
jgi:hypothetical protein